MALTDKLTAIADAIREKTGGTGPLTLAEMPLAIANIKNGSDGGGLPSGVTALASGTLTPATDVTATLNQPHGLGVAPNFFFLYAEGQPLNPADFNYYITHQFGMAQAYTGTGANGAFRIARYSNGTLFNTIQSAIAAAAFNETSFPIHASSTYSLKAGVTYHWVAGVVEGI